MKKRFFEVARRLRDLSDSPKHRLGAVLVYKNRIIGLGFNKMKTAPDAGHEYRFLHAEDVALSNAYRHSDSVKSSTLYLYRENKDGRLANARPCATCLNTIKAAGIKKICFTIDGTYFEEYLD